MELTLATKASGKEFSRPRRTPIRMEHLAGGERERSGRRESYQTGGGGTTHCPPPFPPASTRIASGRLAEVDRPVHRLHLQGASAPADGAGEAPPRHAAGDGERE